MSEVGERAVSSHPVLGGSSGDSGALAVCSMASFPVLILEALSGPPGNTIACIPSRHSIISEMR